MHYKILNKYIGKEVVVFINGQRHDGILEHTPESNGWDGDHGTILLKYIKGNESSKIYSELYIDMKAIDAIQEYLEQPSANIDHAEHVCNEEECAEKSLYIRGF